MTYSLLKNILENCQLSIIVQVLVRTVTLVSNAFVVRIIGQEAIGLINVRLLLLESMLLLLSREAIRKACQQEVKTHDWPRVINLLWMSLPISAIVSFILGIIWICILEAPQTEYKDQYVIGVWMMCISCAFEILGEPPNLIARVFFFSKLRVFMNLIYLTVRTSVFMYLVNLNPLLVIHAFSVAQFISAMVWVISYYIFFYFYLPADENDTMENFTFRSIRDFFPTAPILQLPSHLVKLSFSLYGMVLVKNILQEGERYIMTVTGVLSLTQQGSYDIIQGLGSLPVRLLLRPLEDPLYFYVVQIFKRGGTAKEIPKAEQSEATLLLYYALRCSVCIGLLFIIFGATYSSLVLTVYGGEQMAVTPGPALLRAHGILFLLLAILTVAETFATATLDEKELIVYNMLLVGLSSLYLVSAWVLTVLLGDIGLIVANCIITAIRMTYSLYVMARHYNACHLQPLWGLIPSYKTFLNLTVFLATTLISKVLLSEHYVWLHLSVGLCSMAVTIVTFYYSEPMSLTQDIRKE